MQLPPLLFRHVYVDYLWGGNRIAARFGRTDVPPRCAESWEISPHPDGPSLVDGGPFDGRDLQSLCDEFGAALLGTACEGTRFPLLFKIIDARQALSVQVHPSPADPTADPAEYKNECWHILDAEPGTPIYAGITPEIATREALASLASSDPRALASALVRHTPRAGETLYIPAGLVHAIGAGALIYEVQQNSNTTYRLYDWDRRGPDGKPRALHFDAALRSIDFSLPPPRFVAPRPLSQSGATPLPGCASQGSLCLQTPYFTILEFGAATERHPAGVSFEALFVKSGTWRAEAKGATATLGAGDSLLIPAECQEYRLTPDGQNAAILVTTL
jgi:mannose-6-phosphate isomerase